MHQIIMSLGIGMMALNNHGIAYYGDHKLKGARQRILGDDFGEVSEGRHLSGATLPNYKVGLFFFATNRDSVERKRAIERKLQFEQNEKPCDITYL